MIEGVDTSLAIVGALACIFAFTEFFVRVVRAFRTAEYEKQKKLDRALKAEEPKAPSFPAFAAAQAWVKPLHDEGIAQQNRYYDCLTRSVSSLALALLVLIIGVTLLEAEHWFSTFSATVEVLAFLYVLYQFHVGRRVNADWVRARIQSEIVRQAGSVMAAGAAAASEEKLSEDEQAKWEKIAHLASKQGDKVDGELPERLEETWVENQPTLSGYVANLTPDALQAYLATRARRQLRWFKTSIQRLSDNHRQRESLLRVVFIGCTVIALAKLSLAMPILHAPPAAKSIILVILFIGAAWASAYTAFYLSNNQRSLFHRYNTQVRQIREWLRQCETLHAQTNFSVADAQRDIMWFEALMNGELIDWVRITDYDSMELTP